MKEVLRPPLQVTKPCRLFAVPFSMSSCKLLIFSSQPVTVFLVVSALRSPLKSTTSPDARGADADRLGPARPPDPTDIRSPKTDTLTFSVLNVGGFEITPNMFSHLLAGYTRLPHTISPSEFRPCTTSHQGDHEQVARYWGYHLLVGSVHTRAGVALVVNTSVAAAKPHQRTHIPGKPMSCRLPLHTDPLMPDVTIVSYYGPHTAKERLTCEQHLDLLLKECSIVFGDYNAVTQMSHTTALRANIWPWLVAKERSTAMIDLILPHFSEVPYTRLRRYHGTKSYIDRAYGSTYFASFFKSTTASVQDFSRVTGIQDQNPILVHAVQRSTPQVPVARCALWNQRDVSKYQHKMSALACDIPIPHTYEESEPTYSQLGTHMLTAMREINAQKPPPPQTSTDVTDWSMVVGQLAKQAKRRSKVLYGVSKTPCYLRLHNLPSTRKIQRILQRNTP